jgi:hypothetical protein
MSARRLTGGLGLVGRDQDRRGVDMGHGRHRGSEPSLRATAEI